MAMDYLNETLTNKFILFQKINKFDKFILIFRLYMEEREPTCDKNATQMEIIYQYIFCVKINCEILVEPK